MNTESSRELGFTPTSPPSPIVTFLIGPTILPMSTAAPESSLSSGKSVPVLCAVTHVKTLLKPSESPSTCRAHVELGEAWDQQAGEGLTFRGTQSALSNGVQYEQGPASKRSLPPGLGAFAPPVPTAGTPSLPCLQGDSPFISEHLSQRPAPLWPSPKFEQ